MVQFPLTFIHTPPIDSPDKMNRLVVFLFNFLYNATMFLLFRLLYETNFLNLDSVFMESVDSAICNKNSGLKRRRLDTNNLA